MKRIVVSKNFERTYKKLTKKKPALKIKIQKTIVILQKNPSHPSLRIHKLDTTGNFSISVNMSLRIICYFSGEEIYLLEVGTHDDVY